ncbi:hypothetical protein ACVIWU_001564 [Bradyrhizobium sp. USDA 4509]
MNGLVDMDRTNISAGARDQFRCPWEQNPDGLHGDSFLHRPSIARVVHDVHEVRQVFPVPTKTLAEKEEAGGVTCRLPDIRLL